MDYNTEFQSNNNDLQEILNTLSDLPTYEDIVAEHNISPTAHSDLFGAKANAEDLTDHINDTSVHVSAEEKEKIANIENLELITEADIDAICGATVTVATSDEVTF